MITIRKLQRLPAATRHRKIARLLESWTRDLSFPPDSYLRSVIELLEDDPLLPAPVRELAVAIRAAPDAPLRQLDTLRHLLLQHLQMEPAEWDLLPRRHAAVDRGDPRADRPADNPAVLDGVALYLESIRSPFNMGSILRTVLAFGVRRVAVSDDCPPTEHRRVVRSAMGAVDRLTVVRGDFASFRETCPGPVVALETGGTPLDRFTYPASGLLLLGSEELGLSPELLRQADHRVSIPMSGSKASVNVGVACGIALAFWQSAITPTR